MNQIYPDQGLGQWLLKMTQFATLRYRLYTNNLTPTNATVLGDLTEETTGSYAGIDVSPGAWVSYTVTASVGTALAPPISWTPIATSWTTYGYYVTDVGGTILLAVARFDAAPIITAAGSPLLLTPEISDFSKFTS